MDAKVDNFLSKISLDDDMENMEDLCQQFRLTLPKCNHLQQIPILMKCSHHDPYLMFGDNPRAKVGFISFDGNFQHKHFPM